MIICRLTFLELLMVVGVILILFVLIAPMVVIPHRPREKARQVNCKANLKQIGLALYIYSEENDGFFPIMFRSCFVIPRFMAAPHQKSY